MLLHHKCLQLCVDEESRNQRCIIIFQLPVMNVHAEIEKQWKLHVCVTPTTASSRSRKLARLPLRVPTTAINLRNRETAERRIDDDDGGGDCWSEYTRLMSCSGVTRWGQPGWHPPANDTWLKLIFVAKFSVFFVFFCSKFSHNKLTLVGCHPLEGVTRGGKEVVSFLEEKIGRHHQLPPRVHQPWWRH